MELSKKKLIAALPLGILSLYAGMCMAIFLDQALTGQAGISICLNPLKMIKYVRAGENTISLSLIFSVLILLGIYALVLTDTKTYKSELMEITPDIHIPVPAGQGQYGTARFLKKSEFDTTFNFCIINKKDLFNYDVQLDEGGLVIGKSDTGTGKEKIYHIADDRHSLNIGATRAGKTRNVVLPTIVDLLLAGENVFAVDMKKEICDYTEPFAKKLGYKSVRIDFINPYQSDRRNYLEPIIKELKKGDLSRAIEETWNLVSQLVGEPPKNGEKLWNNGEAATLAASIMAVCYDNQEHPEYQNLTNVFYFITEMCQDYRGALPLQFYIDSLPEDHPSRILLAATKLAAFKTRSSFYVSATMTLKLLTMPSINDMTNTSDFDLEKLIKNDQKTIIYLSLPARDDTYFPLASLTLRQITDEIDKIADEYGGRVPRRWNFIEDEFGNFTKITNITNQTSFGTGKGIRHNFFIQSYAQLEEKYGKEVAQIIRDNCEVTIYLRSPNQGTRQEISKNLDTYTVSTYSLNSNAPAGSMMSRGSKGESTNLAKRELLFPEEIGRIQRPYSLVMTDTHPAIMYAPDLSKWSFNKLLGLGSKKHNQKIRLEREKERSEHEREHNTRMQLWGVWNIWKRHIDILIAQQEAQKRAAQQQTEKQFGK